MPVGGIEMQGETIEDFTGLEPVILTAMALTALVANLAGSLAMLTRGCGSDMIIAILILAGGGAVGMILHLAEITPARNLQGYARVAILGSTGFMMEGTSIIALAYALPHVAHFAGATPLTNALSRLIG